MAGDTRHFGELFDESPRNGLTRPKAVRGAGVKMVNMGELFAYPRLRNAAMDRVPLSESEAERFLLKDGDLLFARQSLMLEGAGKCSIFLSDVEPVTFESHVTRVRLDPGKADPRFYFYYLQSHHGRAAIRSIVEQGAGASGIRGSDLAQLDVQWRPVEEQRAIAHILGTLDDKIELNRRMNETLEALARALFKSWFVDCDPVRAKAEGRAPGLPEPLADLFSESFEDSEVGEIPKGWRSGRLDEVTGFLSGYAFNSKDWTEQGVPVVKIGSVKPGIVDLSATSFVPQKVADEVRRYRLSAGDLLIGMTGYVGEVGLVPLTDNLPLLNQRVGKFVLETPGTSSLAFLYCLTRQPEFKAQVETKSHGTAQANVSAEGILSIQIMVPPKTLRDEFNRLCQPVLDRILANCAESVSLAAQRDTLLPKLISGDLRLTNRERLIQGAP